MASAPFHGFVRALSALVLISDVIKLFIVFAATSAAVCPVPVIYAT
jgi:hypothetical protein